LTSKHLQPTEEQTKAIHSDSSRFIVSASAGSGKTFVLTKRYLRHVLEHGIPPDAILTITFTRKAAAEMKRRIVNQLRELGRLDDAQVAETGPIQTIHSFCERLLRENAIEAAVDPEFEVLADSLSVRLAIECTREAIALSDHHAVEPLLHSLAGKGQTPHQQLEAAVDRTFKKLRSAGLSFAELEYHHDTGIAMQVFWDRFVVDHLPAVIQAEISEHEGPMSQWLASAFKRHRLPVPEWVPKKDDTDKEAIYRDQSLGLVQLALRAWQLYEGRLRAHQALDFTSLELRAVKLLGSSDSVGARLKSQYRAVLVDEAQDLNPLQYRLLEGLDPAFRMLVGDAQQSIYSFREADVRLFQEAERTQERLNLTRNHRSDANVLRFVDHVFASVWRDGYRPMTEPVAFDLDSDAPPENDAVEAWRQRGNDAAATAGYVAELISEGANPGAIALLVTSGHYAMTLLAALKKLEIPARIIGGSERFFARLEIRDVANALRAVATPKDDFAVLACLRSPMVGLSLDSIVRLAQQKGVAHAITEFDPENADDAQKLARFAAWFHPLREYADRLAAWEVIAKLLAETPYLEALAATERADQAIANVRKLQMLATQEPELGPMEYAERIREIQEIRHKEGDAPAGSETADEVQILTVHKAKGLEFDIVVLAQTQTTMIRRAEPILIDTHHGMVSAKFDRSAGSLVHRILLSEVRKKELDEEWREIYVAMTRARRKLCIVSTVGGRNTNSWSKQLAPFLEHGVRVRSTFEPKPNASQ
jgi:ATP-dependent exoDNAse (exonuclease V) beta subunit